MTIDVNEYETTGDSVVINRSTRTSKTNSYSNVVGS